ncbi:MAG: hypothetical protein OIF36_02335 [Alphaproteobacteria bacterium]|nr:hypothetical protein [Alphaproteobacteria bacterium]MCV6599303.1 hypothetical protein [Alphaproteobacteria bacterium]
MDYVQRDSREVCSRVEAHTNNLGGFLDAFAVLYLASLKAIAYTAIFYIKRPKTFYHHALFASTCFLGSQFASSGATDLLADKFIEYKRSKYVKSCLKTPENTNKKDIIKKFRETVKKENASITTKKQRPTNLTASI